MRGKRRRWSTRRQLVVIVVLSVLIAAGLAALSGSDSPGGGTVPAPEQGGFIVPPGFVIPSNTTTLTVTIAGNGAGSVTSDISGNDGNTLNCVRAANSTTGDCADSYTWSFIAQVVTLTATPQAGSQFVGWTVSNAGSVTGGCGLSPTCSVYMGSDLTVSTSFTQAPGTFPLAVLKSGPGQGTVTSAPAGINCGPDCVETYTAGTVVVLTATASPGSTFTGWSGGGCSGTGTCTVTMNAAQTVTANFTTQTFPLTVNIVGQGAVSSNPPGIACPGTCTFNYASGTSVTLTALAAQGWSFQGWTGAGCSGTGTCTVSMTQAQTVTATFQQTGPPPPPPGVQASVIGTRITKTGPLRRIRQLRITVAAEQDLSRIVFRVRRQGVTIQSKTVNGFDADTAVLVMNLRNGIASGRAQLQTTFTNEAGAQKVQTRGIRIPGLG